MTSPGLYNFTIRRGITFGPVTLTHKDAAGAIFDLTGYTPHADVRRSPSAHGVEFSLNPALVSALAGTVTIPEKTDEETALLPCGRFSWDYVLEDSAGKRTGPFLAGTVNVIDINTRD